MAYATCPRCGRSQRIADTWKTYTCKGCRTRNTVAARPATSHVAATAVSRIPPPPPPSAASGPRLDETRSARRSFARHKGWVAAAVVAFFVVAAAAAAGSNSPVAAPPVSSSPGAILSTDASAAGSGSVDPSTNTVPSAITVPSLDGYTLATAKEVVEGAGLVAHVSYRTTRSAPPGMVVGQSPAAGSADSPGDIVHLVIAKRAPAPPTVRPVAPAPSPTPVAVATHHSTPPPAASNCDPNYTGACLNPNASDYDCRGGSGDGPYYTGPVKVVGVDHFGLDADGDGWGCEDS